jgi:hypothetical protein
MTSWFSQRRCAPPCLLPPCQATYLHVPALTTFQPCAEIRCACSAGYQFDYVFDWTILKYQQSQIGAGPSAGRALVSRLSILKGLSGGPLLAVVSGGEGQKGSDCLSSHTFKRYLSSKGTDWWSTRVSAGGRAGGRRDEQWGGAGGRGDRPSR